MSQIMSNTKKQLEDGVSYLSLMEENGMITRESVPYDARLKKIVLTEKALNIQTEVMCFFDNLEKELLETPEKFSAWFLIAAPKVLKWLRNQ